MMISGNRLPMMRAASRFRIIPHRIYAKPRLSSTLLFSARWFSSELKVEETTKEAEDDQNTPDEVHVLGLTDSIPFPGTSIPATGPINGHKHVGCFLVKKAVREAIPHDKRADFKFDKLEQIHNVGVVALVDTSNSGSKHIYAVARARIDALVSADPFVVKITKLPFEEETVGGPTSEVMVGRARGNEMWARMVRLMQVGGDGARFLQSRLGAMKESTHAYIGDVIAAACSYNQLDAAQAAMEEQNLRKRIELIIEMVKKEEKLALLHNQIHQFVSQHNAPYDQLPRFQMHYLRRELHGTPDDKPSVLAKYLERMNFLKIPEHAQKVIDYELDKLKACKPASREFGQTREYLDVVLGLPWGHYSEERADIKYARQVLEKAHYGMAEVKRRILEFIAVGKLNRTARGSIILLVGPPGVGKTSIGKSIADALKRQYYRIAVGGMHDASDLKGHRRTYSNSLPGKVIQAMKIIGTSNPVIIIDEIDKMSRSNRGDPAAALLELLDPEQNKNFLDTYLDIPFDMSKVLFVCTANMKEEISRPLLDRMEVIQLGGYTANEQFQIAKRYLIPSCREESGLRIDQINFSDAGISELVKSYSREGGVRVLRKYVEKIFRKAAHLLASKKMLDTFLEITDKNIETYAGKPRFASDRFYEVTPIGTVMGLAYTSDGGSSLYIETNVDRFKKSQLMVTGKLGEVMKESSSIAYTFARSNMAKIDPDNKFFENTAIHMHSPEGAIPKEGPSAGCAIVTALFSLAMGIPVTNHFALTGEITLTGKVLTIGGLREKLIAAKRAGVVDVCVPFTNKEDYESLPSHVKEGLNMHFVEVYDDVFKVAFPGVELKSRMATVKGHRE